MFGPLRRQDDTKTVRPDKGDWEIMAAKSAAGVLEADESDRESGPNNLPYTMETAPFEVIDFRALSSQHRDHYSPDQANRLSFKLAGCPMVIQLPARIDTSAAYQARIAHPERNVGYEWLPTGPEIPGWKIAWMICSAQKNKGVS